MLPEITNKYCITGKLYHHNVVNCPAMTTHKGLKISFRTYNRNYKEINCLYDDLSNFYGILVKIYFSTSTSKSLLGSNAPRNFNIKRIEVL